MKDKLVLESDLEKGLAENLTTHLEIKYVYSSDISDIRGIYTRNRGLDK